MSYYDATILDYLTKKELAAESYKKPRERCEIYKAAYAHMIRGGPPYERLIAGLDTNSSKTQETSESQEWWKNITLKEELRMHFKNYLEYAADQKVILRRIERDPDTRLPYPIGKGRGAAFYLPYSTRFDGTYGAKTIKKLRKIDIKHGTFLTLTVAARRYDNIATATEALKKGWNRLHRSMDKRFGKLSYLCVLEFGPKNDMPHLHMLIDRLHLTEEDEEWIRKLWIKTVGRKVVARRIRDANAGNYLLKYLEKTFGEDGTGMADGNAWAYWITNSKFYSTSLDVKEQMLSIEEISDSVLADLAHYDLVTGLLEPLQFEYIGTAPLADLGVPPPKILTDKWLLEKGWLYSEEHECWFYAGVGDIN